MAQRESEPPAPDQGEHSLTRFAQAKLHALEAQSLRRELIPTRRLPESRAMRGGRELVSFSCNDYFGLSQHPEVIAAAARALHDHGAGSGASRLVTGNCPLLTELEADLAALKGSEAALIFGSGYLANIGCAGALTGKEDVIILDELSHASMRAGAALSSARTVFFRHNDMAHLQEILQNTPARHRLIQTETVFSMDGDCAPMADIMALAGCHGAWVLSDDAHGLGLDLPGPPAHIQIGTLSKAAGSYGGYVCAAAPVIDLLKSRARSLVFSTGLPPSAAAAAQKALAILFSDAHLRNRPMALARQFCDSLDLPLPQSPIVPVIIGEPQRALEISQQLEQAGYLVVAIRPPTVAPGTARLRITFSASHSDAAVQGLANALKKLL